MRLHNKAYKRQKIRWLLKNHYLIEQYNNRQIDERFIFLEMKAAGLYSVETSFEKVNILKLLNKIRKGT